MRGIWVTKGFFLKRTVEPQTFPLSPLHPGHEVSNFPPLWSPFMIDRAAIVPKTGQLSMDWDLQKCEPA